MHKVLRRVPGTKEELHKITFIFVKFTVTTMLELVNISLRQMLILKCSCLRRKREPFCTASSSPEHALSELQATAAQGSVPTITWTHSEVWLYLPDALDLHGRGHFSTRRPLFRSRRLQFKPVKWYFQASPSAQSSEGKVLVGLPHSEVQQVTN